MNVDYNFFAVLISYANFLSLRFWQFICKNDNLYRLTIAIHFGKFDWLLSLKSLDGLDCCSGKKNYLCAALQGTCSTLKRILLGQAHSNQYMLLQTLDKCQIFCEVVFDLSIFSKKFLSFYCLFTFSCFLFVFSISIVVAV